MVPKLIKSVFDTFPLWTYAAERLPTSHSEAADLDAENESSRKPLPRLHVFHDDESYLSFNPACLKWQAYFAFKGVEVQTRRSNNHSSPSGRLPYLSLPPSPDAKAKVISSDSDLAEYPFCGAPKARNDKGAPASQDLLLSLLAGPIRTAYVLTFYIDEFTFTQITSPLYTNYASKNGLVRRWLKYPLHEAAFEHVLAATSRAAPSGLGRFANGWWKGEIDNETSNAILRNCCDAFISLEEALARSSEAQGEEADWFWKDDENQLGLLDAEVFAYVHIILLLSESPKMLDDNLAALKLRRHLLDKCPGLVQHRARVLSAYFPSFSPSFSS